MKPEYHRQILWIEEIIGSWWNILINVVNVEIPDKIVRPHTRKLDTEAAATKWKRNQEQKYIRYNAMVRVTGVGINKMK